MLYLAGTTWITGENSATLDLSVRKGFLNYRADKEAVDAR